MGKETNIQNKIRLSVSRLTKSILFRNNVGTGWVGKIRRTSDNKGIFIENPRPLNAGLCKGSSDLIGWTTVKVTDDMVGKNIAVFTAVEVKTKKGKAGDDQLNFIEHVKRSGGIAGIATDEMEAVDLINEFK